MTDRQDERHPGERPRVITIAFDAATGHRAAVGHAARIAARLQAELRALYVENAELLAAAGLPVVRQVSAYSAVSRPLAAGRLAAEQRVLARELERALAREAEPLRLRWSFRTVPGTLGAAIESEQAAAEMLILESACRPFVRRFRMRSAAPAAAPGRARSLLLLGGGFAAGGPVTVVFRGGPSGARLLEAAARFAAGQAGPVDLLVPREPGPAGRADRLAELRALLERLPVRLEARVSEVPAEPRLDALVRRVAGGTLALAADDPLLRHLDACDLVSEDACSILLVRP